MWGFLDCTKYFFAFGAPKVVLNDASLIVGSREKLGLLVPPGGGKSTIIKMLAGAEPPNSGHVLRDEGSVPLGYGGAFQGEMSGEENIRNVAALAGMDPDEFSAFCAAFSELGEAYFHPLKQYTGGMRNRLAFAASFGRPASTYLADERAVGGDPAFRDKCMAALRERLKSAGLILVASRPKVTAELCERHAVAIGGKIITCASHEEATELFERRYSSGDNDEVMDEDLASFDVA